LGAIQVSNIQSEKEPKIAMKSHAELLAEIEEKHLKNNKVSNKPHKISIIESDTGGYDPYDNPGQCTKLPDGVDIFERRRSIKRRRG
jgi:hypothetical protein